MAEFWVKLGEMFNYGLEWLRVNAPIIMEWFKNLVLSGGMFTIVVTTLRYIVPLLKNNNRPILAKLNELEKDIEFLRSQLEEQNNIIEQKDNIILNYISLSCKVNAKSITLDDEEKEQFLEISNIIENGFISPLGDVEQNTSVNTENATEGKKEGILDTIEDIIEVTPKVVETVNDLKKML